MLHQKESEIFQQVAYISIGSSVICLLLLICSSIHLMHNVDQLQAETQQLGKNYFDSAEKIWSQFVLIRNQGSANILRFTRNADPFSEILQKCNKCVRLSCAQGPIGSVGQSGPDGVPGKSGEQGKPGKDGADIELDPVHDLPCVVCPGGSPGARGVPGEPGLTGEPGHKGVSGPRGNPGRPGPSGNIGAPGKPGQDGQRGVPGQPGDNIIAGVGLKGKKGLYGNPGYQGPIGIPGRPSNIVGRQGKQGKPGPPGKPGKPGAPGSPGIVGVPGEMGSIYSYCLSDCSKSKALGAQTHNQLAFPFSSDSADEDYELLHP